MMREKAIALLRIDYRDRPMLVRKTKPPYWDEDCWNKFDPTAKWRWVYTKGAPLLEYPYTDQKLIDELGSRCPNCLAYFFGFNQEYLHWEIAGEDLWEELIW